MSRRHLLFLSVLSLVLAPVTAHAIWDTFPVVDTCEWPTTVQVTSVEGGAVNYCTGVYMGKGLVAVAGHCVALAEPLDAQTTRPGAQVSFGEITNNLEL